jgi:WD40 repeat protein
MYFVKKITILWLVFWTINQLNAQDLLLTEHKVFDSYTENILKLHFSPKANYLTISTVTNLTELYDQDYNKLWSYQGQGNVGGSPTDFSPDEKLMVFGKFQGYGDLAVLRMSDQKVIQKMAAFRDYVNVIKFQPTGKLLVAGGVGNKLKVWKRNDEKFEALPDITYGFPDSLTYLNVEPKVEDLVFTPDGKYLIVVGNLRQLLVYEIKGEQLNLSQALACRGASSSVSVHPSGNYLVMDGVVESDKISVLELKKGKASLLSSVESGLSSLYDGDFDRSGNYFASAIHRGFQIYKFKDGKLTLDDEVKSHNGFVLGLEFSPDQNFLASAATDHRAILWQLPNAPLAKNPKVKDKGEKPLPNQSEPKKDIKPNKPQQGEAIDLDFDMNNTDGKNYLLVIGINKYQHWKPLSNATKDAREVRDVLMSRYQFNTSELFELYDEQASQKNILAKIEQVRQKVTDKDNLLIYFSGHGHYNSVIEEGFWIPAEAKKGEETEYLANSTLIKYIKAIQAKHIFLVADACFSGALLAGENRSYVDNVEKFRSRWALTSGRLEFVSDGEVGKNSPFAAYLIKFLKANTKPRFTVSELVEFVKQSVGNNSEQLPEGKHMKNVGDEGGEFVFYLKK